MRFPVKARVSKLQVAEYTVALNSYIARQLRVGARRTVNAVAKHIPRDTGMSAAALLPLAREVGAHLSITPRAGRENVKGKGISEGISQGFFRFLKEGQRQSFIFSTTVIQFIINEQSGPTPLGAQLARPWRSFVAGRQAFESFAKSEVLPGIPNIRLFFKTSVV